MKFRTAFWHCCILLLTATNALSQTNTTQEEAKFIYNFTREVEWPDNYRQGEFKIVVMGSNALYLDLKAYVGDKTVSGQHIIVNQINNPADIGKCQVLFVGTNKFNEMKNIVRLIAHNNTLVITDKKEGIKNGAGINLVTMYDRLNYEIGPNNLTKYGLKFTPDLVDMAVDVPLESR